MVQNMGGKEDSIQFRMSTRPSCIARGIQKAQSHLQRTQNECITKIQTSKHLKEQQGTQWEFWISASVELNSASYFNAFYPCSKKRKPALSNLRNWAKQGKDLALLLTVI